MKKKSLLTLFGGLCCFLSYAQQQVIFNEDFEGYDHSWKVVNNKEFKVKQQQGVLSISKINSSKVYSGCLWYQKTIPNFSTDKNFSIQFDAKNIESEYAYHDFDIQWGKLQQFDGVRLTSIYQLDFTLTHVRLASLDKQKKNGWTYYPWSDTLLDESLTRFNLERDTFNKFEIIQQDSILMVKINDKLVYKIPIAMQMGSEIGFQQCLKGEWILDNLVIKQ